MNIAGLIYLSHDSLFASSGVITHLDYGSGDIWVGGTVGSASGLRVRINDPPVESLGGDGRFGRPLSGPTVDRRWQADQDNPTVTAATSYPMCVPRSDPAVADDPECPDANRPRDAAGRPLQAFTTAAPVVPPADPATGAYPNPFFQAPLLPGDFITFAGTMTLEAGADPSAPGAGSRFVSAHTVTSNTAISTVGGTWPAYVGVEVTLMGTGGVTAPAETEASVRTRFEGSTTDPTAIINLFGVDYEPATGAAIDRPWGSVGVDPGPPNGEVTGRWRFRPPCLPAGGQPTERDCVGPPAGTFLPPPREVRAVIAGAVTLPVTDATRTAANGLVAGQYRAPIFEYIFVENRPGTALVANQFEGLPFLVNGGSTSTLVVNGVSTVVAQLSPWPGLVAPTPGPGACAVPVAAAGGPYSVPAGGTVTLAGALVSGTLPITAQLWSIVAPAAGGGSLQTPDALNAQYTAPSGLAAALQITLRLTLTNACGQGVADAVVTVSAANQPTVQLPQAAISALPNAALTVQLLGSDPLGQQLTFFVSPPAGVTVTSTGLNSATAQLTTPALDANAVAPLVLLFTVTAQSGAAGATSEPVTLTVSVRPPADTIQLSTRWRTEKQRLIVAAQSSVTSPELVLTLQPYQTASGLYDPSGAGVPATLTNLGLGAYEIILVGAPQPQGATIVVKSNIGGESAPTPVQRITQ